MADSTQIFHPANQAIIDDIKKELRLQGHYLTGALESSLTPKEINENGGVTLTASALGYLEDLEKGISPNNISATVEEMTRYVNLRMGYTGKYAIKVAIAILKKQRKEGSPTKASYEFTKTGERKFAVEDTFYNNQPRYVNMLDDATIGSLDNSFTQIKSGTI